MKHVRHKGNRKTELSIFFLPEWLRVPIYYSYIQPTVAHLFTNDCRRLMIKVIITSDTEDFNVLITFNH
jgi:hypothetical protein